MRFSEILTSMVEEGGVWTAHVPDGWLQGRSVFGGLQAALGVRAMRELVPEETPLRVVQTTFVAPVPAGTVRVQARRLRTGKNVSHLEARLVDGDATLAIVVGVFGRGRPSRLRVLPERPRVEAAPSIDLVHVERVTPNFAQHFAFRWLRGGLPFTSSTLRENVVEVSMRDDGPTSAEHVLAIADSIPPIALSFLDAPARGSSLTWTLEMLAESLKELPLSGFRLDAEIVAGRDGYTSQSVTVWGPSGEPVALSSQSMVVFE
jgi:acyl-CoA thioesterase